MMDEQADTTWLDEHHEISLDELIEHSGLSTQELHALIESGVLQPNNPTDSVWQFKSGYLVSMRILARLKHDFELEPNAFALTLVFLEKIGGLEYKLRLLEGMPTQKE